MQQNLERALAASRESRRVAFRERFDADVVKDVIAMANSGGGVILFSELDPAQVSVPDVEFEIVDAIKDSRPVIAIVIEEAPMPIVLNGVVYVRHGAKSEPATTKDLAGVIDRRVNAHRRSWLSAVRSVVHSRAPQTPLSQEVRDSDSPSATPIRVVTDPRAPAFRVIDYDKTHPYRQKELIAAFRERVPGRTINQFDLLSVRHVHGIDTRPEFSHKSLFGTRQYSQKFLDWLVREAVADPAFFSSARAAYQGKKGMRDEG
jgi:hypothetical protein